MKYQIVSRALIFCCLVLCLWFIQPLAVRGQTAVRLITQTGHAGDIRALAVSKTGNLVLTGGADGTARLWRNDPGDELSGSEIRTFEGHAGGVTAVAFTNDDRTAITGDGGGVVRFWNVLSGDLLFSLDTESGVFALAVSTDGTALVTGGASPIIRLWDLASRKESFRFTGHLGAITSLQFSASGNILASASTDFTARTWDVKGKAVLKIFSGHHDAVTALSLSGDGMTLLTGSSDKTVRVWNAVTAVEVKRLQEDIPGEVLNVALSPGGAEAVAVGRRGWGVTFDIRSGTVLKHLTDTTSQEKTDIYAVRYTSDGKSIVTGGGDHTLRLWDSGSGKSAQRFDGLSDYTMAVTTDATGRYFATAGRDRTIHIWDSLEGKAIRELSGHTGDVNALEFSGDGRLLASGSADHTARLWDVKTGKQFGKAFEESAPITSVHLSPDSTRLLAFTTALEGTATLWDVKSGAVIKRLVQLNDWLNCAAFTPDGKLLLGPEVDGIPRLWDTATGAEAGVLDGQYGTWAIAIAPDGSRYATGGFDKVVRLWVKGEKTPAKSLPALKGTIVSFHFSADGALLAVGSQGSPVRILDARTGELVRELGSDSTDADVVRFSPDAHFLITGNSDRNVALWNAGDGKMVARLKRGSGDAAFAFIPGRPRMLLGDRDGTTRVIDLQTGGMLAKVASFKQTSAEGDAGGSWAVVDAEGRFDAAYRGDVKGLHWVVGLEPIQLKQLEDRFHDPQLLSKILGFSTQERLPVEKLKDVSLYPDVTVIEPKNDSILTIKLRDQGGGIGKVVVWVNNSEVTGDAAAAGNTTASPDGRSAEILLDLKDSLYKTGEDNQIRVVAYSKQTSFLQSRGAGIVWHAPGKKDDTPPDVYAVVAGINEYRGKTLSLKFAATDAISMSRALKLGAESWLSGTTGKFHMTLLTDQPEAGAVPATKENFEAAFRNIAEHAKPKDILIVYLAGHGVSLAGGAGYLYLTQMALDMKGITDDTGLRLQTTLSDEELAEWIRKVPAEKKVLVLDTCAAGTATKLFDPREIPTQQRLSLERTQTRTGVFVLMGSTADAPSYEATRFGQGLLTYSLLFGMQGGALRNEEFVDVSKWFHFAEDHVPALANGIGGVQQPIILSPRGNTFDIGRIPPELRKQIPLAKTRNTVLRPDLQDMETFGDDLGLISTLRARLRQGEAVNGSFWYLDEADFPCAIRPVGRYTANPDGTIKVEIRLRRDNKQIDGAAWTIVGPKDQVPELVYQKMIQILATVSPSCNNPSSN